MSEDSKSKTKYEADQSDHTDQLERLGRKKRYVPIVATAIILLAILGTTIVFWARTETPMRAEGAPEEQLLNYMAGRNFVIHGFLSRGFLTDYSLDPLPNAPPVQYSHFPPGPSIIIGALEYVGLGSLPDVRMVMNFIFVAGLLFVVLFFWKHLTPWHGIGALIFLGINNRAVLSNSDHVTYAYWFGLTFLALWALSARKKADRLVWLGLVAIVLTTFMNYTQVVVTMVAVGGLWLIRLPNLTLKRTLLAGAACAGGLALHILQNVLVLGWSIAMTDIAYTLGNRISGEPSRSAILSFAQENDLVLWGVNELPAAGSRFGWIRAEYEYFMVPLIISLVGLGLLAYFRRNKTTSLSLKLVGVFSVSSISWHLILQAHGAAAPLPLTVALPMAMACGFFLGELVPLVSKQVKSISKLGKQALFHQTMLLPALLATAGLVTLWQGAVLGSVGEGHLRSLYGSGTVEELEILRDFRGEGFWTNVTPHLVGYYTESWVIGQVPLEAVLEGDASKAYVTTLSTSSPTAEVAMKPHYFFFSKNNIVLNLDDRGEELEEYRRYFEGNFPALAWSPHGSIVFDLSWGTFGTSHLVIGRGSDVPDVHVRLSVAPGQVTVSGSASPEHGAENLVAEGTEGYWLRSPEQLEVPWVQADLLSPQGVSVVRILPREGHSDQLPDGNSTLLEGSADGEGWEPLAVLGLDGESVNDEWISFPVHGTRAYRYYRISFRDPDFSSLARLEFYTVNTGQDKEE